MDIWLGWFRTTNHTDDWWGNLLGNGHLEDRERKRKISPAGP